MGFFQIGDNLALYFTTLPADSAKASVVFVHGVGEHIGRYEAAFHSFAGQGYSCYGFDLRGFGRSGGERGHIHAFADYVEDLAGFIAKIVVKDTAKPVFLFGHSMGTIVALTYALQSPSAVRGLIVSSCPLDLAGWFANFGGFVGKTFSGIAPRLKIPTLIDPEDLTDDSRIIADFNQDPLIVDKVSVNWLHQFTQAREQIRHTANRILLPSLICHGSCDQIAAVSGAKRLYEQLGSPDKTLSVFDGFKHELLNHKPDETKKVLKEIFDWLEKHG
ncbi:MAG: alpha/beta hydrolase [Gammaproteobacteria bacterium]